jgi:hypothetical protein
LLSAAWSVLSHPTRSAQDDLAQRQDATTLHAETPRDKPNDHVSEGIYNRLDQCSINSQVGAKIMSTRQNNLRLIVCGLLTPVALASGIPAATQSTSGSPLCAARDLEVVNLIEDHGPANDIAPGLLARAGQTQTEARIACSAGHVQDGVAIYDDIIRMFQQTASQLQK